MISIVAHAGRQRTGKPQGRSICGLPYFFFDILPLEGLFLPHLPQNRDLQVRVFSAGRLAFLELNGGRLLATVELRTVSVGSSFTVVMVAQPQRRMARNPMHRLRSMTCFFNDTISIKLNNNIYSSSSIRSISALSNGRRRSTIPHIRSRSRPK